MFDYVDPPQRFTALASGMLRQRGQPDQNPMLSGVLRKIKGRVALQPTILLELYEVPACIWHNVTAGSSARRWTQSGRGAGRWRGGGPAHATALRCFAQVRAVYHWLCHCGWVGQFHLIFSLAPCKSTPPCAL